MNENWATLWETISDTIPEATAIVHGQRRFSYREVEQRAARLAGALDEIGLGQDSKVAILAYNCVEYLEASYAAFKLRGTPVNLNYRYRDDELTEVLEDSDAEVLVFHGSLGDLVGRVAPQVRGLRALVQIDDGSPLVDGALRYDDLLNENAPLPRIDAPGTTCSCCTPGAPPGSPGGCCGATETSSPRSPTRRIPSQAWTLRPTPPKPPGPPGRCTNRALRPSSCPRRR